MIYTPSSKLFILVAFLMAVLVQNTAGFGYNLDGFFDGEAEKYCPEAALAFYKDCHGPIIECSNCLQKAEKQCIYNPVNTENGFYSCDACTSVAGKNCENAHYV